MNKIAVLVAATIVVLSLASQQAYASLDPGDPLLQEAMDLLFDGLMVEVHPQPEQALSDGFQSLSLPQFDRLMEAVHAPMADTSG